MKNVNKYERQYFMPPVCEYDWAKKDHIEKLIFLHNILQTTKLNENMLSLYHK